MKSRPSKLDAHAERLDEWYFVRNLSHEEVQKQLIQDNVSVSLSRLSDWRSARESERLQDKLLIGIATGAQQTRDVDAAFEKNPAPEFEMLIKLLKVVILQLHTKATESPGLLELANQLTATVLNALSAKTKAELEKQKLSIQERRVKLLEEKARAFDQAKEVVSLQLSAEEQRARLKEILK